MIVVISVVTVVIIVVLLSSLLLLLLFDSCYCYDKAMFFVVVYSSWLCAWPVVNNSV